MGRLVNINEAARVLVERTRAAQKLPPKVEDPSALAAVVVAIDGFEPCIQESAPVTHPNRRRRKAVGK